MPLHPRSHSPCRNTPMDFADKTASVPGKASGLETSVWEYNSRFHQVIHPKKYNLTPTWVNAKTGSKKPASQMVLRGTSKAKKNPKTESDDQTIFYDPSNRVSLAVHFAWYIGISHIALLQYFGITGDLAAYRHSQPDDAPGTASAYIVVSRCQHLSFVFKRP